MEREPHSPLHADPAHHVHLHAARLLALVEHGLPLAARLVPQLAEAGVAGDNAQPESGVCEAAGEDAV